MSSIQNARSDELTTYAREALARAAEIKDGGE